MSFASVLVALSSLREPPLRSWYLFFYPLVLAASFYGVRGAVVVASVTYASLTLVYLNLLPLAVLPSSSEDYGYALFGASMMLAAAVGFGYTNDRNKHRDAEASYLAEHDVLTGLYNRGRFMQELHRATTSARRTDVSGALLYLDLDNFKTINDTFGHAAGDELLQDVARVINNCVRDGDVVARIGGDEFVVLLLGVDAAAARYVASRVLGGIREHKIQIGGQVLEVTASLGVAPLAPTLEDEDGLLARGDAAMYEAKNMGRNSIYVASL